MSKGKSTISKAKTYREMGEFWDAHDLADYWDQTYPVEFEIELQSGVTYFPVEMKLSEKVRSVAEQHGVSPETLLNLWIQEKLQEETSSATR